MKADLIKALRRNPLPIQTGQNITGEAADRIDQLQKLAKHKAFLVKELQARAEKDLDIIKRQTKRITALKAKLDRVRKCPEYICAFRDIGKIGGAFRKRDVLRAIGDKDDE